MALKVTRWSPDTCGCKIDIEWDTDNPNVHTHNLITACPAHSGKSGSDILVENQTKNIAIQAVAESEVKLAKLTDDGKTTPNLDKLSYSFDQDRKLTIISKDKTVDMVKIQDELNTKLGIGKVSIG